MRLKRRFQVYLFGLHLVFAALAIWFLRDHRIWLLAVEGFFLLSFVGAGWLLRSFFGPLRLIRSGSSFLRDGDFTIRFTATGHADMDELVDVYNRMADSLREERVRNEEQDQLLRKVMRESPGGVITLDLDGRITMINPAAQTLLGVEEAAALGQPLAELGTLFARRLSELSPDQTSLLPLRGRRRVRCHSASFMDQGFSRRFLLLDELTDELHRSEKQAYEKLVRMMSHEVNNTSGAVQSLLQSCLAYRRQLAEEDQEDFSQALEVAIQRTANLDRFMRDFADVVRLPEPRLEPCDPWEIASQVGTLFKDRFEKAGIQWVERLELDLPRVACDPVQLEQVLVNIIKNACESIETTMQAGEIVLGGSRRGGRCELTIADSGTGLADDVQTQLFNPFFTTRENGQGIGLTMIQEILLGHEFDFSLENRDGGGAVFTIVV